MKPARVGRLYKMTTADPAIATICKVDSILPFGVHVCYSARAVRHRQMTPSWRCWWCKLGLASGLAIGGAIVDGDCALAQNTTTPGIISAVNTATRARRFSIDPSSTLSGSRWQFVDITNLVKPACSGDNTFVITGTGGLPIRPGDAAPSPYPTGTVRSIPSSDPSSETQRSSVSATDPSTNPTSSEPAPLVEAQGWVINDKGEVVLTAHAPNVTPNNPWLPSANCHSSTSDQQPLALSTPEIRAPKDLTIQKP